MNTQSSTLKTRMRLIKWAHLLIWVPLFVVRFAVATEISSLTNYVDSSAVIARIRINSISPVWAGGSVVHSGDKFEEENQCGFVFKAKVIDSLKGKGDEISFFSVDKRDFSGFDKDYLVFIFERDEEEFFKVANIIERHLMKSEEQIPNLRCRSQGKYFISSSVQMMYAFDIEASKQYGGDWLQQPKSSSFTFCRNEDDLIQKKIENSGSKAKIIQWSNIKKIIEKAIANSRKFWLNDTDKLPLCKAE